MHKTPNLPVGGMPICQRQLKPEASLPPFGAGNLRGVLFCLDDLPGKHCGIPNLSQLKPLIVRDRHHYVAGIIDFENGTAGNFQNTSTGKRGDELHHFVHLKIGFALSPRLIILR
ncbi:MAG: hypothetical protein IPN20_03080 [Haliscomenobacter sp.]|nr:hypothetical protein [Haliscomenobacter sp.]